MAAARLLPLLVLSLLLSCSNAGREVLLDDLTFTETSPGLDVRAELLPDDVSGADLANGELCAYTADGTLSGVTIDLAGNRCQYTTAEAAEGITFVYRILVDKEINEVTSMPLDAGQCDQPGPSGLRTFEKIHGNDQSYCLCDVGLCGQPVEAVTIAAGDYSDSFTWDGRNWDGPSDTGNPKGDPFPPGEYTLVVRAEGTYGQFGSHFAITATMKVILTAP